MRKLQIFVPQLAELASQSCYMPAPVGIKHNAKRFVHGSG
jgi:hypothetical protein